MRSRRSWTRPDEEQCLGPGVDRDLVMLEQVAADEVTELRVVGRRVTTSRPERLNSPASAAPGALAAPSIPPER